MEEKGKMVAAAVLIIVGDQGLESLVEVVPLVAF